MSNILLKSPLIISGIGDSQTAEGSYQPADLALTFVPQWLALTAYVVGNIIKNNGFPYRCTTAGTSAASGGPTGVTGSISDGSVVWAYSAPAQLKNNVSHIAWMERFSLGRLSYDLSQGYAGIVNGLVKVFVITAGTGYAVNDLVSWGGGSTSVVSAIDGSGGITAVTVTNPGQMTIPASASITTAGGSGAVLSATGVAAGNFAMTGSKTADMVARLPDAVASNVDVFSVLGGTNDAVANLTSATIIANLRTIYETLIRASKVVIAYPILPRTNITTLQLATIFNVNRWIRAYCHGEAWANTNGYKLIALADPCRYWLDQSTTAYSPIGGSGGTAGAMTTDGLHPSPRGAQYMALVGIEALKNLGVDFPPSSQIEYSIFDGLSPTYNPGGNLFEGVPWQASKAYALGDLVANDSTLRVYRNVQAGTSAGSGGPTGTGSNITDNTAKWTYIRASGMSNFSSGTAGTLTAGTGITYVGNLATGYVLARTGTSTATVTCTIENPWSDGQVGQRQVISWSLGSGTSSDSWLLNVLNTAYANLGIQSGDLGVAKFYVEMEIELTGLANFNGIIVNGPFDFNSAGGSSADGAATSGVGNHQMASSGEMLPYPNGGKILYRSHPMLLTTNLVSLGLWITFMFDASGAANSATCTAKINHISFKRYGS